MTDTFSDFTERHRASTDPLIRAAIAAVDSGGVSFQSVCDVPCSQIGRIYSIRSDIAASRGRAAHAAACERIADACSANPTGSCRLWTLAGPEEAFALFEIVPAGSLAGGFRFAGPFTAEDLDSFSTR